MVITVINMLSLEQMTKSEKSKNANFWVFKISMENEAKSFVLTGNIYLACDFSHIV